MQVYGKKKMRVNKEMNEYINKEELLSYLYSKQDENIDIFAEIANFPSIDSLSCEGCYYLDDSPCAYCIRSEHIVDRYTRIFKVIQEY